MADIVQKLVAGDQTVIPVLYRDLGNGTYAQATAGEGLPTLLTNPGFEVWQRGAGAFTANAAFAADRWEISLVGGTLSVTRDTANADAGSVYCAALVAASTPTVYLMQRLEQFAQLKGRTVTFAVRVKCATASAVRIGVYDSVNGWRYSSYHTGGGAYETLTWTGTISSGAVTQIIVGVQLTAAATAYADSATLAVGSSALAYVPLHPAEEMARCQRYYHEVGGLDVLEPAAAGQATAATTAEFVFQHPVPMVAAPTATVSAAADWAVTNGAGTRVACSALSADRLTTRGCRLAATVAAGLTAGQGSQLLANNTASARIAFVATPP